MQVARFNYKAPPIPLGMQKYKWKWCYTAAISSLVAILCYLNSLSADFVYDDR